MLNTIGSIVALIVAVGVCAGFVFASLHHLKIIKLIIKTTTSKIGFVKNGMAEICGTIVPIGNMLKAPVSERECVYYEFELQEYVHHGKRAHWNTCVEDTKKHKFFVEDDTGKIKVDMTDATTFFDKDCEFTTGGILDEATNPKFSEMLEKQYGFKTKGLIFNKKLRFTETVLAPGDKIYVLGSVKANVNETIIKNQGIMLVADRAEKTAIDGMKRKIYLYIFGAFAALAVAGLILYQLWR